MDAKVLTEAGWKAVVAKFKIKDNGLQKALASYEDLAEDDYDAKLRSLASLSQLAGTLKRAKEVAAIPDAVKYLTDLPNAAQSEQREVAKAKELAKKTEALNKKKADADAKKQEEDKAADEDEEEEAGDYREKLITAYKRLKASRDVEYNFIVCDARPQCAVLISKPRISYKQRAELSEVTGGSKRFLKEGKCHVESGKLVFDMQNPPSGLAVKLKKSLKYFTGLTIGVVVGDQSDEEDEGPEEQPTAPA
jgi:hypothetical protein